MNKLMLLGAVGLVGCGAGYEPETYELVLDNINLPGSCFTNMMAPNTVVSGTSPSSAQVQVWDAPEGKAFLQVNGAGGSIDMGDAPNITVNGIFEGTRVSTGWAFVAERTVTNTQGANKSTDHGKVTFTFDRAGLSKGTLDLTSSRTCEGTGGCTASPTCTVAAIGVRATRIAVDYQKAP